jgi:hypothetical protein
MYYVYALIDHRNNTPFYIGKGKGNRWKSHLSQKRIRKNNWFKMCVIENIRKDGFEPGVIFLEQNIISENLAYELEESYIQKFGKRQNGGCLVNICDNNRPPNFSGKTYKEIYGKDKWEEQVNKRRELQILAGGYGPKMHKKETKEKISKSLIGNKRRAGKTHNDDTKSKMSESHKKRFENKGPIICLENSELKVEIRMSKLKQYCLEKDLSYSTFLSQIYKNWPTSKRGKNKGWKAYKISSYLEGAVKSDINENTFQGFEL